MKPNSKQQLSRKQQRSRIRKQQPRRQMMGRRRNQVARSSTILPPLRNQFSNLFRTTLRVVWDVGQGGKADAWKMSDSFQAVIDTGYIFVAPTNEYLKTFTAHKVHQITARWMQAVITADKIGFNAMSLVHPEFSLKNTGLNQLISSPASVVRPDGQVALTKYKPLEPTEFDWIPNTTNHAFAVSLLKTFPSQVESWFTQSSKPNGIWGKFIVDVDVSLNGMGTRLNSSVPQQCFCASCTDPIIQGALRIQNAYNAKHGGLNLLPYLSEAAQAGVSPTEYLEAHSSSNIDDWHLFLSKILPEQDPGVVHFKRDMQSKFPPSERSTRFDVPPSNIPSPIPSDYDIAD